MNGNRADQGGAASAGRKSVGCTSIPAQRRAVKAIPVDDVEQIARGCKGDSNWNSDALILCEDVAFALRRKVPALSGIPLLEVEGIVKDTVHQQIEDALRDVISCAVEVIIDVQQDMIETPHEPRSARRRARDPYGGQVFQLCGGSTMADEVKKPKLEVVTEDELDEEEKEFRALRRDLPGSKGASAIGIVSINVGKTPGKNEFFRTHADFRPVIPLVDLEVGMERTFFAVTDEMVEALAGIGITVTAHTLYLTVTPRGAVRIVPIRHPDAEGNQNEYHRTKEIGLLDGIKQWVRLYTDLENRVYKVFPAPAGRFADPVWPVLKPAKIFRLAFRDKGRLVDSPEHPLFQKWAARDSN